MCQGLSLNIICLNFQVQQKSLPDDNNDDNTNDQGTFLGDIGPAAFVPVQLTADDIPDARLPNPELERNTVPQLRRWLQLRGIPTHGNKSELVQKCVPMYHNLMTYSSG